MLDAVASVSDTGLRKDAEPGPVQAEHHVSFHDVLTALNPLQYLPVIGTIYRSVTGDQIAEPIRRIGSAIVSGLMGGPIGVAIDLVMLAAEKVTGVDLDQTGQKLLAGSTSGGNHSIDHAGPDQQATESATTNQGRTGQTVSGQALADQAAMIRGLALQTASLDGLVHQAGTLASAQATAPGAGVSADGTSKWADIHGADVLNAIELSRIRAAGAAYAQTMTLAG
jgi:hypothetical protein